MSLVAILVAALFALFLIGVVVGPAASILGVVLGIRKGRNAKSGPRR